VAQPFWQHVVRARLVGLPRLEGEAADGTDPIHSIQIMGKSTQIVG